jgi:hypothetical protein
MPDPQPRRRRRRPFHPDELSQFLRELARTGNVTLAAAAIGRPKGCLYVRRRTDPDFAFRCEQALALFHAGAAPGGYVVQRGGPGGRVQLRRAARGALRPADLERYFGTLAATGSLRLATGAIGRTRRAMLNRRVRDPVFARAEARALKSGVAALEAELVHSALAAIGEHGESDWLDDFGAQPAQPGKQADELPGTAFSMSADDAMLLLFRYWRKQERLVAGTRRKRVSLEPDEPEDDAALDARLLDTLVSFGARVQAGTL